MKLKLLSIITVIALSVITVGVLGGCGGSSGKTDGSVKVTSITVSFDNEYFENLSNSNKIDDDEPGTQGIYTGLYRDTLTRNNNSSDMVAVLYYNDAAKEEFKGICFVVNMALKFNVDILPANASNKQLSFSAVKVDILTGDVIDSNIDINDYITISPDGTIKMATNHSFGDEGTIKVTVSATDGSGAKGEFYITNWLEV